MRIVPVWVGCLLLLGCRTLPDVPAFDISQTGWQVHQGQAVWRPNSQAPELSGELVWASHPDGRFLLQFLKTPITLVEARGSREQWQIAFPARGRTIRGSQGRPLPQQLGWLHLAGALKGENVEGWTFRKTGDAWKLANDRTGETIEGYLQR